MSFIWVILFQSSFENDQGFTCNSCSKWPLSFVNPQKMFFSPECQGMLLIQKVSMRDCRPIQGTYRAFASFCPFWSLRPETRVKHHKYWDLFYQFFTKKLCFLTWKAFCFISGYLLMIKKSKQYKWSQHICGFWWIQNIPSK